MRVPVKHFKVDPNAEASYGAKHARTELMRTWLQKERLPGVAVPPLFCLSSTELFRILAERAPKVLSTWKELGPLAKGPHSVKDRFFKEKLRSIRCAITEVFRGPPPANLQSRIDAICPKDQLLIIRSTGAEDGIVMNAGIHDSVLYVPPIAKDAWQAAGKVVSSYFSEQSLANRIASGETPFDNPISIPVTVQHMIAESVTEDAIVEDIPVSAVVITNNPTYVDPTDLRDGQEFRVMTISSTYGNGEAVVGNLGIGTDTFSVTPSRCTSGGIDIVANYSHKPLRRGPKRELGSGAISAQDLLNPPELHESSSLPSKMLFRIHDVCLKIEQLFCGEATNIELVVWRDTIYLVQARPVRRVRPSPSYVDPRKTTYLPPRTILEEQRGRTQVMGAGEVLILRDPNSLLTCDTLGDAERDYQSLKHRAIVIHEREPLGSHYIVNFENLGIAAIQISDTSFTRKVKLLISHETPLVIDVQDATLRIWNTKKNLPEDAISQGWVTHPADIHPSVCSSLLPAVHVGDRPAWAFEVEGLLRDVRMASSANEAEHALRKLSQAAPSKTFFSELRQLHELAKTKNSISKRRETLLNSLKALEKALRAAFDEAFYPARTRMETLYRAKVLEKLLLQEASEDGSLGRLSLLTAGPLLQRARAAVDNGSDLLLDLNEELYEAWSPVINSLSKKKAAYFAETSKILTQVGLLSQWLRAVPAKAKSLKPPKDSKGVIKKTLPLFAKLLAEVRLAKTSIKSFGEPSRIDQSLKRLNALIQRCCDKELAKVTRNAIVSHHVPTLVLASKFLEDLVDLYDSSIKAMKSSRAFNAYDQMAYFKAMVRGYLRFLGAWEVNLAKLQSGADHRQVQIRGNVQLLEAILNSTDDSPKQLRSDPNFNMAVAVSGEALQIQGRPPKTIEELFTTIHGFWLRRISKLSGSLYSQQWLKEQETSSVFQAYIKHLGKVEHAALLSVDPEGPEFVARYYTFLRCHSLWTTVRLDKMSGKTYVDCNYYGDDEAARWEVIFFHALIDALEGRFTLTKLPLLGDDRLSLSWELTDDTVEAFHKVQKHFEDITFRFKFASWGRSEYFWKDLPQDFLEKVIRPSFLEKVLNRVEGSDPIALACVPVIWEAWREKGQLLETRPLLIQLVDAVLKGPPNPTLMRTLRARVKDRLKDFPELSGAILNFILRSAYSEDPSLQEPAIYTMACDPELFGDKVIDWLRDGATKVTDPDVWNHTLRLAHKLAEQDKALDEGVALIEHEIATWQIFPDWAQWLLRELIERSHGLEAGLKAVELILDDPNRPLYKSHKIIFKHLFYALSKAKRFDAQTLSLYSRFRERVEDWNRHEFRFYILEAAKNEKLDEEALLEVATFIERGDEKMKRWVAFKTWAKRHKNHSNPAIRSTARKLLQ